MFFRFKDWLGNPALFHVISDRTFPFTSGVGANSKAERLKCFCEKIGIGDRYQVYFTKQVHSSRVLVLAKDSSPEVICNEEVDGLICRFPGKILCVFHADCIPLFYFHSKRGVIAILHVGRRGLDRGIIKAFRDALLYEGYSDYGEGEVKLGPSIGPCCYFRDLWAEIGIHLKDSGFRNVENPGICTSCNDNVYFSYSRDKGTSCRMVSLLAMI